MEKSTTDAGHKMSSGHHASVSNHKTLHERILEQRRVNRIIELALGRRKNRLYKSVDEGNSPHQKK